MLVCRFITRKIYLLEFLLFFRRNEIQKYIFLEKEEVKRCGDMEMSGTLFGKKT